MEKLNFWKVRVFTKVIILVRIERITYMGDFEEYLQDVLVKLDCVTRETTHLTGNENDDENEDMVVQLIKN